MRFPYNPGRIPDTLAELAPALREEQWALKRALEGAPILSTKKLTGTTNAAQGGAVNIPHGLTASKIVSVTAIIAASGPLYVPPNGGEDNLAGYAYNVYAGSSQVVVTNVTANSVNITSKPVTVIVTYED
jgi:hypothetical protein